MCELTKDSTLYSFIQSSDTIDKIALGLESENKATIRGTLMLLN